MRSGDDGRYCCEHHKYPSSGVLPGAARYHHRYFFAQIIGMFLQDRGQYLATQIPISAALALVLGATGSYPLLCVFGTLVGSLIGTGISLLFSPPNYVFRTQDAVAELTTRVADAIPKLAAALTV